jgi:hypothetical protein
LGELRKGRDEAEKDGLRCPSAVGVAVEELEAWLLADETALASAAGSSLPGAVPDPEGDPDPKSTLSRLCPGPVEPSWRVHEVLAERLRIGELRKRCSRGFEPFYQELCANLADAASTT